MFLQLYKTVTDGSPYLCAKSTSMLQVQLLLHKTDYVKERLAIKKFKQPELVDAIIAVDDERKKVQAAYDTIQSTNAAEWKIG